MARKGPCADDIKKESGNSDHQGPNRGLYIIIIFLVKISELKKLLKMAMSTSLAKIRSAPRCRPSCL